MNLPALTTTPREMVAALARVADEDRASLVEWTNVPAIADIVTTWAAVFATPRAESLGLHAETSFDDIIRDYIATSQPQH
jgi:hypothetical protein